MPVTCEELWVTMNDGVRLDASVYIPEGEAPVNGWPVIVSVHGHGDHGPKGIGAYGIHASERFAGKGYLGFCYNVRGHGRSEGLYGTGAFCVSQRELFDLQDIISWVSKELPVNPDRIAVTGPSMGGMYAYMAAIHCPQVRTVVAENIYTNAATFAVPQGCLSTWFITQSMRRCVINAGFPDIVRNWAISGDWHFIEEWMRPVSPFYYADRIQCPVMITHGWGDVGMPPNEAINMFNQLHVPKKMIIGEGGHLGLKNEQGKVRKLAEIDRWMAHWLKDEDTGMMEEPEIMYSRLPDWSYHQVEQLPPKQSETMKCYLHPEQALHDKAPMQFDTYSNVNNVLLVPDYDLSKAIYSDLKDISSIIERKEVSFRTTPTAFDYEVIGAPQFCFHMLSNHPSFQVHAELYDCTLEGDRHLISRGHYGTRCETPGKHTTIEFEGRAISYQMKQGHTLELVVVNCFPGVVLPYFNPFKVRLFHDDAYASNFALSVIRSTNV